MAGFYSEKIVPEVTETDQKLARRLEFVLWRELQYYAGQFSQFFKIKLLTQITDEASVRLLDVASYWLTLNHIKHEKKNVREIAADGAEVDYPSHVRVKLISTGWIFGVTLFEKDVLPLAKRMIKIFEEYHQAQRIGPWARCSSNGEGFYQCAVGNLSVLGSLKRRV